MYCVEIQVATGMCIPMLPLGIKVYEAERLSALVARSPSVIPDIANEEVGRHQHIHTVATGHFLGSGRSQSIWRASLATWYFIVGWQSETPALSGVSQSSVFYEIAADPDQKMVLALSLGGCSEWFMWNAKGVVESCNSLRWVFSKIARKS
jgi:hypothetical protein